MSLVCSKFERSIFMKKRWANLSIEEKNEIGKKISNTKNTPEGRLKAKLACQKCRDKVVSKLKGRSAHNKMEDFQKVLVKCLTCGREKLVVPSVARTKKFCCRGCSNEYKKGKPHKNWNPNSFHDRTGNGIAGRYKDILFRSSYELSFIYRAFELGDLVVAEPFRIRIYDYLSDFERKLYDVRKNKTYTPDYLLNGHIIVEIKCSIVFGLEFLNFTDILFKLNALANFCKKNNYDYVVLTEEEMGELLLTDKQIKLISKSDIMFFKEKHRERYR